MLSILKKKKANRPLVYVLIFAVLLLTVFNLYKLPKLAKAGVTVSGDDVTISGGIYVIDSEGNILQEPSYTLKEKKYGSSTLANVPKEYYSYLFTDTGKDVSGSTNLSLTNSAVAIMEGTQNLASLTVSGSSSIKQPYPDREGKLNKPIYTEDHWLGQMTGYFKLDANSMYWLRSSNIDNYMSIEVGSGDTINSSTTWSVVYRNSDYPTTSGWSDKNVDFFSWNSDATTKNLLKNTTSSAKYIPIRLKFGDRTGPTRFHPYYNRYNLDGSLPATNRDGWMKRSYFCGIGSDGKVDMSDYERWDDDGNSATPQVPTTNPPTPKCGKPAQVDFDYYISKDDTDISFNLGDGVRSAGKKDFNLYSDFSGGFGDWADNDSAYADLMYFYWNDFQTPYGMTASGHSDLRAARYSGQAFNAKAYDGVRRISGGLTLNISGDTTLTGGGKIDLQGFGYPGYSNEMGGNSSSWGRIRGGSQNFDGSPGGGYSNAVGCNGSGGGGGSHGGQGGEDLGNCKVGKRSDAYGNELDPTTMGSGGGSGNDDGMTNIAGSGGGYLRLKTRNLTLGGGSTINADGTYGEYVGWHTIAGGSGGGINIEVNGKLDSGNGGYATITARGGAGMNQTKPSGIDWHVGGGGGRIAIKYASTNLSQAQLDTAIDVSGAIGGYNTTKKDDYTGGNGTRQIGSANVSTEVMTVTKETKDSGGNREATFQVGDQITVELRVYDPGSTDRDDFKIEDAIPKTSGTISVSFPTVSKTKNYTISAGKITITGDTGQGIVLKPGENLITYTYTL